MSDMPFQGKTVSYQIEYDDASDRASFGNYHYRIYENERLIARYWQDSRGDEHGIEFIDGTTEAWPVGRMIDFIEGGGPEPLRLSERAVSYLRNRKRLD